jgi:hypothetical protein
MNGDLTRVTFDPLKRYLRVVMQQGRVQLDADWNEQTAILLHFLQTLAADLIGQHGGPPDLVKVGGAIIQKNLGFEIITSDSQLIAIGDITEKDRSIAMLEAASPKILIGKGRYYVEGRLCEIDDYLPYSKQLGYPWLNEQGTEEKFNELVPGLYLAYLDVWERFVTSLEDPGIREVALNGADTAARYKQVWQIKIKTPALSPDDAVRCVNFDWDRQLNDLKPKNRGSLRAKAKEDSDSDQDKLCIAAPDARFRGVENHLYRVEVHQGGMAANNDSRGGAPIATFKWSRENGSIVAPVLKKDGNKLIVGGFRDSARWFTDGGQWVELTHDEIELRGARGTMVWATNVDGETLSIDANTRTGEIFDPSEIVKNAAGAAEPKFKHLKARAWDHKETGENDTQEGALKITETESGDFEKGWMDLEDGVQIQFVKAEPAHKYRTGDYWLIPARIITGDVEWPVEKVPESAANPQKMIDRPKAMPPHGVEHHYAPLAIVQLEPGNRLTVTHDLRHRIDLSGNCIGNAD